MLVKDLDSMKALKEWVSGLKRNPILRGGYYVPTFNNVEGYRMDAKYKCISSKVGC